MTMNLKYEKFYETDTYIFYGQYAFEEDVKLEQKEEYEKILYNLKKILNIEYEINNNENVTKYIEKYEPNINEEDIPDFIKFVKIILEKLYLIISNLKKVKIVSTKQTIKNMEMDIKRMQRLEITREKEQQRLREKEQRNKIREEKEEERRKEKETKRILKEKIEMEKENNRRIVKCPCGIQYALYCKLNHLKSNDHIIGLNAVKNFIKEHNLNFDIDMLNNF